MDKPRPTRANGRAKRKAILAAALEVFATHGYRGTSLTEIAKRVGMTQPGLLHHFGTKEAMLLEVVTSQEERTAEQVNAHLQSENMHLDEAIRTLGKLNQELPVEQKLLTTLSTEAIHTEHPLHEYFRAVYEERRQTLGERVAQEQAIGRIRSDVDPHAVAREIIATLDGLRLQWLLDPDRVQLDASTDAYARRMMSELASAR